MERDLHLNLPAPTINVGSLRKTDMLESIKQDIENLERNYQGPGLNYEEPASPRGLRVKRESMPDIDKMIEKATMN